MELFYIILLVFFGLLFLVAELVLLPGVSVGALLALVSDGSAIYLAFRDFGATGGAVTIAVIIVLGSRRRSFRCAPRPGSASRSGRRSARRARPSPPPNS